MTTLSSFPFPYPSLRMLSVTSRPVAVSTEDASDRACSIASVIRVLSAGPCAHTHNRGPALLPASLAVTGAPHRVTASPQDTQPRMRNLPERVLGAGTETSVRHEVPMRSNARKEGDEVGRTGLVDDEQVLLIVDAAQDERLFCYEDRVWSEADGRRMQRWVRILTLGMKRIHGERIAETVRRAGGLTPYAVRADREFHRDLERMTTTLLTPPTEAEMARRELHAA